MARIDQVVDAVRILGGHAFLKDIYIEAKRIDENIPEATIRREIERHSSDSESYIPSNRNLFFSVDGIGNGHWGLVEYKPSYESIDCTQDDAYYSEGKLNIKKHIIRERNPKLIRDAKQRFIQKNGKLFCEVCKFNFEKKYGQELGGGFIEAHHTIPVSSLSDDSVTRIEDIVLLCSNCHSMIHRKKNWLTKEQLCELIKHEMLERY